MESIYPEVITTFAAVVLYGVPVAVAVLSYLLGCINGAIATSHLFYHDDVRRHGSGNAGLTNFYRNYGAKCAPMVIAFDMLKAVGAVLLGNYFLGYLLGWGAAGKYFGALFCVIGHMFPVFYGFKGGKGVSSTCGVMLMTFWWQALICYVITIALIAITKFVSLGSLALVVLFGILVTATNWGNWLVIAWVWVIAGLCIYRHHANIGRLIHGTERKIGQKA